MHALEEKERSHREKQMKKDYKKELDSQMAAKRATLVDRARVHEGDRLAMVGD
ncbi:hypothetical protein Pmar_PMAR024665 [Perkinsus marinus ATCC 50983]|uniref:Uncharacterized protein n=1 Tax=Perkinsus marinus (strain ATCC 50983 / TXsc) TaxID=423536 RepID=C5M1A4_PERM5|nr:hypothetical protein Pmar_PMAR024665 [Perkinsus marinus ATCC 50983]EEQ97226.1 hypothetical protein Pmar_PMAR024665 [Perkinsus marinus ATCC 50983]|eukprot:XP_002764509.1 hypothetical protein Pmar_PMAR024665 [Perkinsus marinus ATCC 50983]